MAGEQHPFDLPHEPEGAERPGVGDTEGAPQGAAPGSSPPKPEDDLRQRLERLEPLGIIAEALKDPGVQQRVISAITGAGAPPRDPSVSAGPSLADQEKAISARYSEQRKAAMAAGDFDTAFALTEQAGAEIGELRATAQFQTAASPVVSLTATNTIEGWIANKKASSPYFTKLESKFRALIASTPPAKMAELAMGNMLISALETGWNKIAAEAAEGGYNKNFPVETQRQVPPNYSMGGGGGAQPERERVDDADRDDEEFQKLAEAAGVQFSVDGKTGAIIGEMK